MNLIDRRAALDVISRMQTYKLSDDDEMLLIDKKEVQTNLMLLAVVQPQRMRGRWIADVDRWGEVMTTVNGYICSECRVFNTDKDNYCPNCGADMRGEQDG